jgi:hypothetical protein
MNTSTVELDKTARTCVQAAELRAQYIANLGCKKIIEACVGPSLQTLEKEYSKHGIECWGNDIDSRWAKYYPKGRWILGNALDLSYIGFDLVVFAPPLSKGCSGKREDALSPLKVMPSFLDFLATFANKSIKRAIITLPGRSLSTKQDRTETYHIINKASKIGIVKTHPLYVKGVLKYLDLQIDKL